MDLRAGFQIERWTVHPEQNRLSGPDGDRHLNSRAMDVLLYLAERAGEVVSREDFSQSVWGSAVVTDDSLTWCISELRRTLGDKAANPHFIETIPKRGYRLIAPVSPLNSAGAEADDSNGEIQPRRMSSANITAAVSLALLASLVAGAWFLLTERHPPQVAGHSLAVLPFERFSIDDPAVFSEGLHHDLLTRLSHIEDLRVISRTSVRQYRDTSQSIEQIAADLDVSWILEGAVQQVGDEFRLNAQLIDAATDSHVWAKTYHRTLNAENLFAIQAEIVEDIASAMATKLTKAEVTRIQAVPTRSVQAYDFYLQAITYQERDWVNQEDYEYALALYQRAIEADPDFALAHAGMARAHLQMFWNYFDPSDARLARAGAALEQALSLDPANPEVRLVQGIQFYWAHRDYERALEEFAYARDMLPNNADVHLYIGAIQRRLGRWDEAVANLEAALELDPRNISTIFNLQRTYLALHDFPGANRILDRAGTLFPDSESVQERKLWTQLSQTGDLTSLVAATVQRWPDFFFDSPDRWLLLYTSGHLEFIIENADRFPGPAVDMQRRYYPRPLLLGLAHDALDESSTAERYFRTALEVLEQLRDERPEDPRIRSALGRTFAALGLNDAAVAEGRRAMALLPTEEDAQRGPAHELEMAKIHARLGNNGEALAIIERLLNIPFDEMSPNLLRVDPDWDRIRNDPEFQHLAGNN